MRSFENIDFRVSLWQLYLGSVIALLAIFSVALYYSNDDKVSALVSGLVGGLLIYIVTFVTNFQVLREIEKHRMMGVTALLTNRHDKDYYRNIVSKAQTSVKVMGSSCARFIEDFLDVDSDDKVLVDAMQKFPSLTVQLLVPDDSVMEEGVGQRWAAEAGRVRKLNERFPGQFSITRFGDHATHSFVMVDDDLIAGPIFQGDESKHAPAVHVRTSTPYGQKYLLHFNRVVASSEQENRHESGN